LIPADPELPGFVQAFDMSAVRARFAALRDDVLSCRIERFRHRGGERASFLYELTCGDGRPIWANASLYRGKKAKRLFRELGPRGRAGYFADLGMLVEFFPDDRRMGGLRRVLDGAHAALSETYLQGFGVGSWTIETIETVPVRYRPGLAAVFKTAVAALDGSERAAKNFYIKVYGEGDPSAIFQAHDRERNGRRHTVLRPLAVVPELQAIVWPEAPGASMAGEVAAKRCDIHGIRDMAHALAEFHESDLDLPIAPASDVAASSAHKHATFIASLLPEQGETARDIAARLAAPFETSRPAPMHHDMKPEHLLLHRECTTLLDIEGIVRGDPALDWGNLLAPLHSGTILFGQNQDVCRAAMEEIATAMPQCDRAALAAAFALGKLKLATYAGAHQLPDWPMLMEREIAFASRALAVNRLPFE
jgi:hypothetical protein